MARRHGRSPRGERLDGPVLHGHRETTTFLAGLTDEGVVAPCITDDPMNGVTFLAWTEQMLASLLATDDIAITDNLAAHEVAGVRQAIEARGESTPASPLSLDIAAPPDRVAPQQFPPRHRAGSGSSTFLSGLK
jgi:hypothetical protein